MNKPNILTVFGIEVNLNAVKSGKKDGTKMNKTKFKASFPKKRVLDGEDKDGKPKFKMIENPRIDEIWDEVQKALK